MEIIHILTGQRNHLIPQIVKSFLINKKMEHVFVFINGKANFNIYKEILSKYENDKGDDMIFDRVGSSIISNWWNKDYRRILFYNYEK